MNAPRLAMLVLWAALAPAVAFAGDGAEPKPWITDAHSARNWLRVGVSVEGGESRYYWARLEDLTLPVGSKVPLYKLEKKQDPERRLPFYETRLSPYYLIRESSNDSYSSHREGSALNGQGAVQKRGGANRQTFEAWTWDQLHPPGQGKPSTYNPANFNLQIVVAAPDGKLEDLPPSPLAQYSNSANITANAATIGPNEFAPYFDRIFPFQRIIAGLDADLKCYGFPVQASCKSNDPWKRAIAQVAARNDAPAIDLAVEGRGKAVTRAKAILAGPGPKNAFSADEINVLYSLFQMAFGRAENGKTYAENNRTVFLMAMNEAQKDPLKLEAFVAHWRGLVQKECTRFVENAGKATRAKLEGDLDFDEQVEKTRDNLDTAFKTPLGAPVDPNVAAAAAPAAALLPEETPWLTKTQAQAYERAVAAIAADAKAEDRATATSAAATTARGEITKNLAPNAAAATYKTAADKKPPLTGELREALKGVDVWGKGAQAIVGKKGAVTDLQLTEEEYKKLKPEDRKLYDDVIVRWGGTSDPNGAGTFNKDLYDPIALHNAVVVARAAIAGAAPAVSDKGLSEDEKKLLTPTELAAYKVFEAEATKKNPTPKALETYAAENVKWRKTFAEEGRKIGDPPYPTGIDFKKMTTAQYAKVPEWQRKKICNDEGVYAGGPGDGQADPTRAAGLNTSADARQGLNASAADGKASLQGDGGATGSGAATTGSELVDWSKECPSRRRAPVTNPNLTPRGTTGNIAGSVPGVGDDKEVPAKEKSKWISQDLVTNAVKGGMVGLLVGSLFGPAGLIIGPIVGAALFYGITKLLE